MTRYGSSGFNLPTVVTDTFNRANGNLGNADSGQAWLTGGVATTAWVVSSNVAKRASATTSVSDVAYIDIGKTDVILSADIVITNSSQGSSLIARMSGTTVDNCMRFYMYGNGTLAIMKFIGGVQTTLAQTTFSYTSGASYSCTFTCRGNIFSAYINGVLKVSTEDDNALKSNTKVGMFLPCTSLATSDWFDNFVAKG